ncbi:MAG: precorrin methylase [Rhodobacteraceae bacterium]|nr:precorrin methylase [Paracoccaceae bacterium]
MIVAGFGCRSAATLDSLRDALARASGGRNVDALATVADKARSTPFRALARDLGLPLQAVPSPALADIPTPTDSPAARATRQTGSVAEASALWAAGPGARLIGPRVISADRLATCALAASAPDDTSATTTGPADRPQGDKA